MAYVYVSPCHLVPNKPKRTKKRTLAPTNKITRKDLPISEQRKSALAVHNILKQLNKHDDFIAKSIKGVDTSPPSTRHYKKWRDELRKRDPMPELDLPLDVKNHYSWTQLCYLKKQKEWHEHLVDSASCTIDMELPKHVKQYQEFQRNMAERVQKYYED